MKNSKLKFSKYMQNISRSKSFGRFVLIVLLRLLSRWNLPKIVVLPGCTLSWYPERPFFHLKRSCWSWKEPSGSFQEIFAWNIIDKPHCMFASCAVFQLFLCSINDSLMFYFHYILVRETKHCRILGWNDKTNEMIHM